MLPLGLWSRKSFRSSYLIRFLPLDRLLCLDLRLLPPLVCSRSFPFLPHSITVTRFLGLNLFFLCTRPRFTAFKSNPFVPSSNSSIKARNPRCSRKSPMLTFIQYVSITQYCNPSHTSSTPPSQLATVHLCSLRTPSISQAFTSYNRNLPMCTIVLLIQRAPSSRSQRRNTQSIYLRKSAKRANVPVYNLSTSLSTTLQYPYLQPCNIQACAHFNLAMNNHYKNTNTQYCKFDYTSNNLNRQNLQPHYLSI